MATSGSAPLSIIAFVMTQMSVHSPTNSTSVRSGSDFRYSMSAGLPKPGFSNTGQPVASSELSSFQPSVPRMQCGTGSLRPSCVCA